MRIFVSGSLAYDRIMNFPGKFSDHILPDKIHILNVSFLVDGLEEKFGGTAGNIAYTLKLLGEDPVILSTSGKDFGAYEKWLKGCGLSMKGIKNVPSEFTAGAYITTDKSDNQITGFNPGAMKYRSDYAFDGAELAESIGIVGPGNIEDMQHYSRVYKNAGTPFIFDPGQNIPAFSGEQLVEMLTGATYLISNDYELEMIMNATKLGKGELLERVETIVTTLGEEGSIIRSGRREDAAPAAKARQVKDPTGAGDSFRSGFMKGLSMGKTPAEAAKMGSVSAVYAVENYGTQEHSFTLEEYWKRFEENFG